MATQSNRQSARWSKDKAPYVVRYIACIVTAFTLLTSTACPSVKAETGVSKYIEKKVEAVARLQSSSDKAAYADAVYDLATAYNNDENYEQALKYYEQSLSAEQSLNRPDKSLDSQLQVARVLLMLGKKDEAFNRFNDAIAFCKERKLNEASAETSLATTLVQIGKLEEAESHYRKALAALTDKDVLLRAKLYRALADICQRLGRFDDGLMFINDEVKIRSQTGDEADYGRALVAFADFQNRTGHPLESIKTYEQVKEKFNAQFFPDVLALTEFGLAENYYDRQKIDLAREHYAAALKYARENEEDTKLIVKCLTGLGIAEADLEQFDKAEAAHSEAVQLAAQAGLREPLVEAEVQLAQDCLIRGNPERALQYLTEALRQTPQASRKLRAGVLAATARCYAGLGEYSSAARYYREAATIFGELQDRQNKAMTLNSLAVLHLDQGDYATFDKVLADSKDILATLPPRERAKFEYNNAQSKVMRGQFNEAIALYSEALKQVDGGGDEGLRSAILRGAGTANYLSGNYAAALDNFQKAHALSKDSGSIEAQWDCSLGLGKVYKALKRYDEAEPCLRQSVALVEKERSHLTRDSFKTFNLDLRKNCFQELVDLLVRTGRAYESLEIAERGKARAFLDMLANRKERRIANIDGAGTGVDAPQTPVVAASNDRPQLIAVADAGTRSVNVSGKLESTPVEETAVSPVNADPPDVKEIKELVAKRKSTCVEYFVANDQIYTWVVNPDGTIYMPPPSTVPANLRARVAATLGEMTKATRTLAEVQVLAKKRQAELRSFYDLLIKPVEQYLPTDQNAVITIVPHDILFCVPFAALLAPDGSYLIEKHTLSYAPAIGVLRATQRLQQQAETSHKLLAFGNPITERIAFLGALPYAEKEVKRIAQIFGESNTTIETGGAATKARFAQLAPQASEIHLATHGLVDEERPMRSALVLAPTEQDDGMLSVRDILTLKNLKARIVVLSACQTGRGKITGDGVVGLSRAFIIAGAPAVVVSQWNVDDIMTAFQMERFYKAYLHGSDRAKALRDAQLATIKFMEESDQSDAAIPQASRLRANPRFWAAFQLIGEI